MICFKIQKYYLYIIFFLVFKPDKLIFFLIVINFFLINLLLINSYLVDFYLKLTSLNIAYKNYSRFVIFSFLLALNCYLFYLFFKFYLVLLFKFYLVLLK